VCCGTAHLTLPARDTYLALVHARLVLVAAMAAVFTVTATASPAAMTTLKATLSGKYLHTTSSGSGSVTVTLTSSKVCWRFSYSGIDKPNDSGIHIAPPPSPAKHTRSVFPFTATTSTKPGCVPVDKWGPSSRGWAAKIAAEPSRYYVIVTTDKYRYGAIGGALRRG
jgi:CHRD domain